MKMRRRKFGIGLKIASLLTTIAVVSVGLASWVITAPTIAATADGTIKVDTVSTNAVTLAGTWVSVTEDENAISVDNDLTEKPVIYYGAPEKTIEGAWLTNKEATADTPKYENLTAWLKVTATTEGDATVSNLTVTFTASDSAKFNGAIAVVPETDTESKIKGKTLIGAPKFTVWAYDGTKYVKGGAPTPYLSTDSKAVVSLTGSTAHTYIIKVEFSWGTAFNNENAYEYFNKKAYDSTSADIATEALTKLNTALSGVTYIMTVSAD